MNKPLHRFEVITSGMPSLWTDNQSQAEQTYNDLTSKKSLRDREIEVFDHREKVTLIFSPAKQDMRKSVKS